jgi:hypothetical protein
VKLAVRVSAAWILVVACATAACATAAAPAAGFPLKASPNGRFLVDRKGAPFLVVGDTAWSLIAQPDEDQIDHYLDDRAGRGYSAIIVNLIEHRFATHAPNTHAGLAPFTTPGDFATPNPAYFDFAHRVVEKAAARGICVFLFPTYLGANGGEDGWFRAMKASGRDKVRGYAKFVAERFRDLPNVVWAVGGDFTPPPADLWTATDVGDALHGADPGRLITGHGKPEDPASVAFGARDWLTLDAVYSYNPSLFDPILKQYARNPPQPFVLLETTYEGEHDSKPEQIRRLAWWSMLGGACGQFFGNNPIWHYDGPGVFESKATWQEALDSPGSRDVARMGALLRELPWQEVAPEQNHAVVTAGYGKGVATAVTAITADRRLALTYVPSDGTGPRELTVDLKALAGPASARWFNPAKGGFTPAADGPLPDRGTRAFKTPGDNGTGTNDWLLLIDSRTAR